ncbi:MAG: hypothetical protein ACI87J_002594 [Colwellia sp.]|jgi:hypothetical protein
MRPWFLDLRTSGDLSFDISPHLVQIARSSYIRSKRNSKSFVPDPSIIIEDWFDIDKEVYESLSHQHPNKKIIVPPTRSKVDKKPFSPHEAI